MSPDRKVELRPQICEPPCDDITEVIKENEKFKAEFAHLSELFKELKIDLKNIMQDISELKSKFPSLEKVKEEQSAMWKRIDELKDGRMEVTYTLAQVKQEQSNLWRLIEAHTNSIQELQMTIKDVTQQIDYLSQNVKDLHESFSPFIGILSSLTECKKNATKIAITVISGLLVSGIVSLAGMIYASYKIAQYLVK